jgi:cytochrome b6-f complex iron-sulfur subunit
VNASAVLAIAVAVVVVLGLVGFLTARRRGDARRGEGTLSRETLRRDTSRAGEAPLSGRAYEAAATATPPPAPSTELVRASSTPAVYVPPDPEVVGVSRRQFFNRTMTTLMGVGLGGFGVAVIGFLWPKVSGGFGGKVNAGKVEDLKAAITQNKNFFYLPEGRSWITAYPKEALPKAEKAYSGAVLAGMREGFVALYQKCPHLGCRVPNCPSSQWFECPCHGSQYNRVGEKKGGPAPRGMDRFGISIINGAVIVDTGLVVPGPPIGTNTTGQEAEGPHCVGGGGGGH